jgi:hypothetical protein
MATATPKTMTISQEVKGVSLDLTPDEVRVLSRVLDRIGGDPAGPRGHIDTICEALAEQVTALKIHIPDYKLEKGHGENNIYFETNVGGR